MNLENFSVNLENTPSNHEPFSSSPLSSPTDFTRRRGSQFKPRTTSRYASATSRSRNVNGFQFQLSEPPQKSLWRGRLFSQIEERAKKERELALDRSRGDRELGDDANMEDEDTLDALDDEIYRRVMLEERRRAAYHTRREFEQEFGGSDDLQLGDIESFERQFTEEPLMDDSNDYDLPPSSPPAAETRDLLDPQEDPEKIYETYLQEMEEDEYDHVFEPIDDEILATL